MRILVEITHPAHVHFFRNAIGVWKKKGHQVAITARDKDIALQLLDNYGFEYVILSRKYSSKYLLINEMIIRDFRLWRFCKKFKPDVLTGISAVFASHVGLLIRKPVVIWDDTETATICHKISVPFATAVCSPEGYLKDFGRKHHLYAGCHELAYLHPNRFTPDIEIVKNLGVNTDEKYCIVRMVKWEAHHDIGQHGFGEAKKVEFIKAIAKYARPYITSECKLPYELEEYRIKFPPDKIHHVMAFSSLYVGEGVTMASESAVLGVPTVYVNTMRMGYIDMHERYGLLKKATDADTALKYSLEWLSDPDAKKKCQDLRQKLLNDKIDVTEFIVEMIEKNADCCHS